MTVTTAPGGHHHLPVRTLALGVAGAGVAVGAVFALSNVMSDEGTSIAPGQEQGVVVPDDTGNLGGRLGGQGGDAGHRTQLQPR